VQDFQTPFPSNQLLEPLCHTLIQHCNHLGRETLDLFSQEFHISTGTQGCNREPLGELIYNSQDIPAD
jgi:hypothetical protein